MADNSLVGIFGGTFDPVHNGHLQTVVEVSTLARLQQVIFIPAGNPPHRDQPRATAQQRFEMVSLAASGLPGIRVDDRELRRSAPSYTVDTVQALRNESDDMHFCLIVGMDAFLGLESWFRWRDLLEMTHFLVMQRPGWKRPGEVPSWWSDAETSSVNDLEQHRAGKILIIDVKPVMVSATQVRNGISQGTDVSSMVPAPVLKYIHEQKLYQNENEIQ